MKITIHVLSILFIFTFVANSAVLCESKTQKGKRLITDGSCPSGYIKVGGSKKRSSYSENDDDVKAERLLAYKAYFGKTLLSNVKISLSETDGENRFNINVTLSEGDPCVRGEIRVLYSTGGPESSMVLSIDDFNGDSKTAFGSKSVSDDFELSKVKVNGVGFRCLERPELKASE